MRLITHAQRAILLANGQVGTADPDFDPFPVVKLFMPDGSATWLLAGLDPDNPDLAFGLCDLGLGFPELGSVSLAELAELRGIFGLPVERDRWFVATQPLSAYATEASRLGHVRA